MTRKVSKISKTSKKKVVKKAPRKPSKPKTSKTKKKVVKKKAVKAKTPSRSKPQSKNKIKKKTVAKKSTPSKKPFKKPKILKIEGDDGEVSRVKCSKIMGFCPECGFIIGQMDLESALIYNCLGCGNRARTNTLMEESHRRDPKVEKREDKKVSAIAKIMEEVDNGDD
jgi:hypothetical protein